MSRVLRGPNRGFQKLLGGKFVLTKGFRERLEDGGEEPVSGAWAEGAWAPGAWTEPAWSGNSA